MPLTRGIRMHASPCGGLPTPALTCRLQGHGLSRFPNDKFRFFPQWSLWSGGGGGGQQPAQPPIRQQPGAADAQTAHPATFSTAPGTPTTGLRERGNDTSRSTGRSGRQNAATRRNMRREERVTVQGPVKEQQPDGMSHGGGVPPPFGFEYSKDALRGGGVH